MKIYRKKRPLNVMMFFWGVGGGGGIDKLQARSKNIVLYIVEGTIHQYIKGYNENVV